MNTNLLKKGIVLALAVMPLVGSELWAQKADKKTSQTSTKKKKLNKTQKGAIIGAGAGAVLGGIIAKKSNNTAIGAILGATVGGAAGAVIGRQMDKQAEEIAKDLGGLAKVERVGEGIKMSFDGQLLFDYNSATLRQATQDNLAKLSTTLSKYNQTDLVVEGHTDGDGSYQYNQALSERRANSVAEFLKSKGVEGLRLKIVGYGEQQPISDNTSDAGKQMNRRVEIAITANDKMKKDAKDGTIDGVSLK
jgi:outer membrane protein OmpA-like peptidoglycan-associated protein